MVMSSSPRHRQRGMGLIEVSLAILIGVMIISAAVVSAKNSRDRADAISLNSEEMLVFSAADSYFRSSCRSGSLPSSVLVATLVSQGYLPRAPRNVWGASWSVTYLSAPRRAQVSASLPSAPTALMPFITAYADGYSYSGNTVTWLHNIRIVSDTTSANAMDFKAMYEPSNC